MSHYEATVNIKHLSTSTGVKGNPKATGHRPLAPSDVSKRARAALHYITRESACADDDLCLYTGGGLQVPSNRKERRALKAKALNAFRSRLHANRNNANGCRALDKFIISLPADATPAEHRQMAQAIVRELGGDSQALLLAAIHRDKKGNPHLHIWAVDGKETKEAAKARRPDAKRVRQGDHMRLNELGSRKPVRARVAAAINGVGQPAGRRRAEVRSYADRGISRTPQKHEGLEAHQKNERANGLDDIHAVYPENHPKEGKPVISKANQKRLEENMAILAERLIDAHGVEAVEHMPPRYKSAKALKRALWDSIARRLNNQFQSTTAMQAPSFLARQIKRVKTFLTPTPRPAPTFTIEAAIEAEKAKVAIMPTPAPEAPPVAPERPPEARPTFKPPTPEPVRETARAAYQNAFLNAPPAEDNISEWQANAWREFRDKPTVSTPTSTKRKFRAISLDD
jgi:hypothetical protein